MLPAGLVRRLHDPRTHGTHTNTKSGPAVRASAADAARQPPGRSRGSEFQARPVHQSRISTTMAPRLHRESFLILPALRQSDFSEPRGVYAPGERDKDFPAQTNGEPLRPASDFFFFFFFCVARTFSLCFLWETHARLARQKEKFPHGGRTESARRDNTPGMRDPRNAVAAQTKVGSDRTRSAIS